MTYFEFLGEHGPTLLMGATTTVKVLICSTILYVIISMIFGLMRISKNPIIQGIATVYIEIFRGTSLLVQLFWFYYVLPFFGISLEAFVAGVLSLGMNFGAYGAEIVPRKSIRSRCRCLLFRKMHVLYRLSISAHL